MLETMKIYESMNLFLRSDREQAFPIPLPTLENYEKLSESVKEHERLQVKLRFHDSALDLHSPKPVHMKQLEIISRIK